MEVDLANVAKVSLAKILCLILNELSVLRWTSVHLTHGMFNVNLCRVYTVCYDLHSTVYILP